MFGRTRPWLAAGLALLYPGLGHLYLRAWIRAVAWFGLAVVSLVVFVMPEMSAGPGNGFSAFYGEFMELPLETIFPLLVVNAFNVVDAYLVARRSVGDTQAQSPSMGDDGEAAASCPNCGRDLDEELDFCPWCTTRLEQGDEEDSPA